MDDKIVLLLLFNNNILRTNLIGYENYICDSEAASNLIRSSTKYFKDKGYKIEAIDGSEELCQIASEYSGIKVECMLFQDLNENDQYDGIWACASILHLSKTEMKDVLKKMIRSLKKNGIIYTSFKYGEFEGMRNNRYFSDFTEKTFQEYLINIEGVKLEKQWVTADVRPDRGEEKWLNIILRKSDFN